MAAFDFKSYIIKTIKANTVDLGVNIVKTVGYTATNTVKSIGENAVSTIQSVPERVTTRIKNIPEDVANIPVAPGLSIENLVTALSNPAENKDDFTKSVEAFTGVNINRLSDFNPSPLQVQARLDEFAGALRRQVMLELQNCIERYLRGIINKNLDIFQLINFESFIANEIAKLRIRTRFKIQKQIENLLYDKLKIQQIALLKQRILQEIRKLCPSSGGLSPTITRRLQTDRTWEIAEPESSITESANKHSMEHVAKAHNENSTGQETIDVTDNTMAALEPLAKTQAAGYDDASIDDFVTSEGAVIQA